MSAHVFQLQDARLNEWTAFGGTWGVSNNTVYNNHGNERGVKLLAGSNNWRDYTLSADVRFSGDRGDMGVIIRSNDEAEGIDSYNGYYVGLRVDGDELIIGRSNYGWVEARPVLVPGGITTGVWYRLRATAYGCNIAASIENLNTGQIAWIAFEERSCVKAGRIGLRSVDVNGMWRNVSVSPAMRSDYLDLQRHAASVEQPVVLNGPPWWTPWHAAMLFVVALALALLVQLSYFRVQRWKTYTIMQERERLAHEIHDTMAQSFAGVGYQIQGIRSSVIKGSHPDLHYVAEQLSVAYQLIRRCHAEASGTIAMLGLSMPLIQHQLLETLQGTATRIAGDRIHTTTELRGNITPLNLRLADALLHIGNEAIANAISHSDLTTLTLILTYEDSFIELVVSDNGKGFDYSDQTAGFGVLGMQKRARHVDATLTFVSSPGRGTTVYVKAKRNPDGYLSWITAKFRASHSPGPSEDD